MGAETGAAPPAELVEQVADALEHLYDLVYLRSHPIVETLMIAPQNAPRQRAHQLRDLLIETIQELDPGADAPPDSFEWRRHRVLLLRFVKGLTTQAVADQSIISLRHYYRVLTRSIEDLSDLLWGKRLYALQTHDRSDRSEQEPSRRELLRLEAARAALDTRYVQPETVVDGVIELLGPKLTERNLGFCWHPRQQMPAVAVDANLLRQILIATIGQWMEQADRASVLNLRLQADGSLVRVQLHTNHHEPDGPTSEGPVHRAIAEIAALARVNTRAFYRGDKVVGFDLSLPVEERSILIVDDNEDVLSLFEALLQPQGYRVIRATSAREGLAKAREHLPYAITVDLMLPEHDGWELLQWLTNHPETSHIPVIVCTVLDQKALALALGASVFLEKPFTAEALFEVLDSLLGVRP